MSKHSEATKRTGVVVLIVVILIAAIIFVLFLKNKKDAEATKAGLAYLTQQENKDLKQIRANVLAVQKEQEAKELSDPANASAVWKRFGNDVILGDSRAVGFSYYKYLPENRVLAKPGNTINIIESHFAEVKALNPSAIILVYGTNDAVSGVWSTPEEYAKDYKAILKKLHKEVPDAEIYVCGTLPCTEKAVAKQKGLGNIPAYNEAVQAMCKKTKYVTYLDMSTAQGALNSRYEPDGIHVNFSFYPIWAKTMKEEM